MPPLGPAQLATPRAPRNGPVDPDADLYIWDHCSWSEVVIATQGTLPEPEARIRLCTPPRSPEPEAADTTDGTAKTATTRLLDAQRTETLLNGFPKSNQTLVPEVPETLSRQVSLPRSQSREPRGKGLDLQADGIETPSNHLATRHDQSTPAALKRPRAHEPELPAELAKSPVPTTQVSHSAKKMKQNSALQATSTSQPHKTPLQVMVASQRSSLDAGPAQTSLPQTSLPQTSLPQTSLPQTSLPQTSLPQTETRPPIRSASQTKAPQSKATQSKISQSKTSRGGPSQIKATQNPPSIIKALQLEDYQNKLLRAAPRQNKAQQTKAQQTKAQQTKTQQTKTQESTPLPISAAKTDRLLDHVHLSKMKTARWIQGQKVEVGYDNESQHISSILSPDELDRQRYKESAYVICPLRFQDRLPWKWRELYLQQKAPHIAPISPRAVMEAFKKAATGANTGVVVINTPDVGCYEWQIRFESERMANHWIGKLIRLGPGMDLRLEPFSLHYVARVGPLINGRNLDRVVDAVSRSPDIKGAKFWLGVPGHQDTIFDRALVVFRTPPRLPQFKTVVRGLGEYPDGYEVIFHQIMRDNQLCECCDEQGHNARFCQKVRPVHVDQGGHLLLMDRPWLVPDGKDVIPLGRLDSDGQPQYLLPVARLSPWRNHTNDF